MQALERIIGVADVILGAVAMALSVWALATRAADPASDPHGMLLGPIMALPVLGAFAIATGVGMLRAWRPRWHVQWIMTFVFGVLFWGVFFA